MQMKLNDSSSLCTVFMYMILYHTDDGATYAEIFAWGQVQNLPPK